MSPLVRLRATEATGEPASASPLAPGPAEAARKSARRARSTVLISALWRCGSARTGKPSAEPAACGALSAAEAPGKATAACTRRPAARGRITLRSPAEAAAETALPATGLLALLSTREAPAKAATLTGGTATSGLLAAKAPAETTALCARATTCARLSRLTAAAPAEAAREASLPLRRARARISARRLSRASKTPAEPALRAGSLPGLPCLTARKTPAKAALTRLPARALATEAAALAEPATKAAALAKPSTGLTAPLTEATAALACALATALTEAARALLSALASGKTAAQTATLPRLCICTSSTRKAPTAEAATLTTGLSGARKAPAETTSAALSALSALSALAELTRLTAPGEPLSQTALRARTALTACEPATKAAAPPQAALTGALPFTFGRRRGREPAATKTTLTGARLNAPATEPGTGRCRVCCWCRFLGGRRRRFRLLRTATGWLGLRFCWLGLRCVRGLWCLFRGFASRTFGHDRILPAKAS